MSEMQRAVRLPMASPDLDEAEILAVTKVVRSHRLTMGSQTAEFEEIVANYCGARYGIAVSSGTAGLHLLCCAAGLGPGDEVITSSFSFVASTNCLLYVGATPVFVDIDPQTYCLDPEMVEQAITPRTKAILAVDVFGTPAEWDRLSEICQRKGLVLIADACESLGAEYKGRKCGPFGIGGVFAFFPNKQITTGEGGMIVTNDQKVADICRRLRNQGRDESGPWLTHLALGYNYRITELSAAVGIAQFKKLTSFLEKRQRVADMYQELLRNETRVRTPRGRPGCKTSYFVYVIEVLSSVHRDQVIGGLAQRGIPSRGYFAPIHLQPYIRARGMRIGNLPITEQVASRTIALPFHNNLARKDAAIVVDALREVLDEIEMKT
jgi:perosamine synthetase